MLVVLKLGPLELQDFRGFFDLQEDLVLFWLIWVSIWMEL
jgi:hypothetical protein